MPALNINGLAYYVTGVTRWDDGREHPFDEFVREPIVCPQSIRYEGPTIRVAYVVTRLACEVLNAASQERTQAQVEQALSRPEFWQE